MWAILRKVQQRISVGGLSASCFYASLRCASAPEQSPDYHVADGWWCGAGGVVGDVVSCRVGAHRHEYIALCCCRFSSSCLRCVVRRHTDMSWWVVVVLSS